MKFRVNFSVDSNYDIIIEADSKEEAEIMVESGDYKEDDVIDCGKEFLHINNVEEE